MKLTKSLNVIRDSYRYGFQGQEKDDEIKGKGNSVNFKYRMHDPRLGRFFAIDPMHIIYSSTSPYSFSENCVISAIEFEGLETHEYKSGLKDKLAPMMEVINSYDALVEVLASTMKKTYAENTTVIWGQLSANKMNKSAGWGATTLSMKDLKGFAESIDWYEGAIAYNNDPRNSQNQTDIPRFAKKEYDVGRRVFRALGLNKADFLNKNQEHNFIGVIVNTDIDKIDLETSTFFILHELFAHVFKNIGDPNEERASENPNIDHFDYYGYDGTKASLNSMIALANILNTGFSPTKKWIEGQSLTESKAYEHMTDIHFAIFSIMTDPWMKQDAKTDADEKKSEIINDAE